MFPILGIIAAAAVITAIDMPTLWRKKYVKEMWVFSILLLIGTGLSIAWVLHVKLPSPLSLLAIIYHPFNDFVTRLLT
ncbi:hypothetical protein [Cohnella sp. WQ 127256]|uniref:hypothetical protein n=1 Tax=Cohnella sp. WQ 127256 TaxID=2938790 RepID=UPI0021173876|nr:hypothetical protein [Cohnella sp. WQ 127256]